MLAIDLTGKRAFVAGVADDGGFGFAIAKALAEAGASVAVGTWPPAMNIFLNLLERGKMDPSLVLPGGGKLAFERIYALDAAFDTLADAPAEIRENKRSSSTAWPTGPRSRSRCSTPAGRATWPRSGSAPTA
jgi:enoyl-[acyl-carrier protein] reductase I